MERIRRNDYIAQVSNLLGKGDDMENPVNADLTSFRELSEKIKAGVVEGDARGQVSDMNEGGLTKAEV